MAKRKGERRWNRHGELRLMAEAEGYVMVRRLGAAPFVCSRREWMAFAEQPPATGSPDSGNAVKADGATHER